MNDLMLPNYPGLGPETTPTGTPGRGTYSATGTTQAQRTQTVAGLGAVAPIVYGRVRVGASVAAVGSLDGDLVLCLVWALGECDAIEGIVDKDGQPITGVTFTHYLGTPNQPIDPTLASAIDGWDKPLVATLRGTTVGLCYSVARITRAYQGAPAFVAQLRGRKVYDPRDPDQQIDDPATWVWSDNPALCWADFERSPLYGRGLTVDDTELAACADAADEEVQPGSGEKRRTLNLAMLRRSEADQWSEALRGYAGAFRVMVGDTLYPRPDRPGSATRTLTDADVVADRNGRPRLTISRPGLRNHPTVVHVIYTDKSREPWTDGHAWAFAPGVLEGTTEWRETTRRMDGIDRYSQAHREAVETLNRALLADLNIECVTHDEALADQVGDIVRIISSFGLENKPFRIVGSQQIEPGRWRLRGVEYQPGVYSDAIETVPTIGDTVLPSPFDPPPLSGLTIGEEVYQQQNGTWSSRIRATWQAAEYAFLRHYQLELWDGAELIYTTVTTATSAATPPVAEGVYYTLRVRAITTVGAAGPWATVYLTAQGKRLIPGDVPALYGIELGGEVRLRWPPAVDIDIRRYEVRFGVVGTTWEDAAVIDRVDALRLTTHDIPAGDWDFMVKAIDSIGQYSRHEARVTVTVTLDTDAYQADEYEFQAAATTNMHAYRLGRTDTKRRWVVDFGVAADQVFTATPLDTHYPDPAATYRAGTETGQAEWLSETWDAGRVLTGDWHATVALTNIVGQATPQLELSEDGQTWAAYPALRAKTRARYARIRITGGPGDTWTIEVPGTLVQVAVVPREESGSATSQATGPTTIALANHYAKTLGIVITPLGNSSLRWTIDNLQLNTATGAGDTFDVYLWDANDNQVAADFIWTFKGV